MIPGGTLVKSTLAAGLSGALDPKASLGDQLTSGAISAVSNVVPAAVTSKLLPATRLAGDINVGGSGDDLLKAFPSFKPTSAQVSPRSPENAIYRSMGIDDAARLSQARSITKDLMSKAGIEGQELTGKSLTARAEAIEQSFNQLLSPKIKVKVGGLEQAQFLEAAKNYSKLEPAMAKSPTLAMIHRALSNDKPELIRASDLHRAWKEAKEVTGDFETTKAIRSVLESLITKAVPEGQKDVFGRLTSQWDLLQDLNRIYHAGGQGTGPASGALAPSKIEQYVSSGQVRHPAIDQTVELIKRFGVTDYRPARIGADSLLSPIADITKAVAGPVLRHAEVPAPVKQLPPVKFMIDLLRAGGMRGVAATDDLRE